MKKLTHSTEENSTMLSNHTGFLAAGSLIGAILASSCCIVPFILLTIGVSGAWISNLTILAPYQSYFLMATFFFLIAGFWKIYRRPKGSCGDNVYCPSIKSDAIVKSVLWLAMMLVALALGVNFLGPLLS